MPLCGGILKIVPSLTTKYVFNTQSAKSPCWITQTGAHPPPLLRSQRVYEDDFPSSRAEGWKDLGESDRQALCLELRGMVQSWRSLEQNSGENYIGAPSPHIRKMAQAMVA
ncbi:hypothetical protein QC764_511230 [Podospora pseudoanserina]|uniref:Uncharacterized protein n=1 Tax=Podospora pseudoanserina TaxID=2609844 RepID=A0ABR0I8T4_9PEZI|nr:hypothetical protein QC764_511230 [Podospora pseudoanserina]